jgi:hypothetical protein
LDPFFNFISGDFDLLKQPLKASLGVKEQGSPDGTKNRTFKMLHHPRYSPFFFLPLLHLTLWAFRCIGASLLELYVLFVISLRLFFHPFHEQSPQILLLCPPFCCSSFLFLHEVFKVKVPHTNPTKKNNHANKKQTNK